MIIKYDKAFFIISEAVDILIQHLKATLMIQTQHKLNSFSKQDQKILKFHFVLWLT